MAAGSRKLMSSSHLEKASQAELKLGREAMSLLYTTLPLDKKNQNHEDLKK